MRKKRSKYTYQLFKLVDEGGLDELAKNHSMTSGNLEYSYRNKKVIYGQYYVLQTNKARRDSNNGK